MTKKALVIEDDTSSNLLLCKTMQSLGFSVVSSTNGAEGLFEFFKNDEDFDIILLDIMMPEVGGEDFIRTIESLYNRDKLTKRPTIIVETAIKDFDQLKQITANLTVHCVHEKPINVHVLKEIVTDITGPIEQRMECSN